MSLSPFNPPAWPGNTVILADQRGTIEHGVEPVVPLGFSGNPMASTYAPRATNACFRPVLCVAEPKLAARDC
jgi:hypothetical protein